MGTTFGLGIGRMRADPGSHTVGCASDRPAVANSWRCCYWRWPNLLPSGLLVVAAASILAAHLARRPEELREQFADAVLARVLLPLDYATERLRTSRTSTNSPPRFVTSAPTQDLYRLTQRRGSKRYRPAGRLAQTRLALDAIPPPR